MMMSAKNNHGRRLARGVVSMGKNKVQQKREDELARAQEDLQRREANRIHCKETRDRKRERERLLREVRLLQHNPCRSVCMYYV